MAQEVTIKGKTIPKGVIGSDGSYNYIPYTTAILDGTRIVPGTSSNIKVGLEITESNYNQLRNNPDYAPLLTTINGTRIVNVGELDSKGNFISSPYVNNTDQNSKNIINELRNGSQFTNSINEEIQRLGYANGLNIDQNAATQQPSVEQSNTSAANPTEGTGTGTATGTGGTPTTGTATSGPATGTPPTGTTGGTTGGAGSTPSAGAGTPVGGVTRGQATLTGATIKRDKYKVLTYPAEMKDTQDKIKFTVWKHKNRGILNGERGGERGGQQARILANNLNLLSSKPGSEMQNYEQVNSETVYLPVTKISDTNSVDWSEDSMNTLQRQLAQISLDFMQGNGSSAVDQMGQLLNYAKGTEFYDMALLYLAGQAVGVDGMIARGTGAIFNPNLELLFRGPQLRSFTFNFPMISRNDGDAASIKGIINYFKKYMAPRATENNVFLNSPFVFKIEYLAGNKEHPSLNKIKMCALQACNVDYTPMGSYMTFTDTTNTMFMYTMALQFKELHPIYDIDYGSHPIGY